MNRKRKYDPVYYKKWRKKNKNKLSLKRKARYIQNKEKEKYDNESRRLFREYGLTREAFDKLKKGQKNKCAIKGCSKQDLVVDHEHKTGKVRGLLCRNHNSGIGLVGDTYKSLILAADYLRKSEG